MQFIVLPDRIFQHYWNLNLILRKKLNLLEHFAPKCGLFLKNRPASGQMFKYGVPLCVVLKLIAVCSFSYLSQKLQMLSVGATYSEHFSNFRAPNEYRNFSPGSKRFLLSITVMENDQ